MKKAVKIVTVICALLAVAILASCSSGSTGNGSGNSGSSLPGDVPVPPGASYQSGGDFGIMIQGTFETGMSVDDVKAFYDANMPSNWAQNNPWRDGSDGSTGTTYNDETTDAANQRSVNLAVQPTGQLVIQYSTTPMR